MEKITFVNENAPYVSAENLNQMQTNVENAINGIVESGSNANGRWIKWADGTMIVTQLYERTYESKIPTGSLYWGAIENILDYPVSFTQLHSVSITAKDNNLVSAMPYDTPSNKPASSIYLYSSIELTGTLPINVIAIGRWK